MLEAGSWWLDQAFSFEYPVSSFEYITPYDFRPIAPTQGKIIAGGAEGSGDIQAARWRS
jgi:hypothetical protein